MIYGPIRLLTPKTLNQLHVCHYGHYNICSRHHRDREIGGQRSKVRYRESSGMTGVIERLCDAMHY